MPQAPNLDGILITWGDRLFYPRSRVVKVKLQPKLNAGAARQRAATIRQRIEDERGETTRGKDTVYGLAEDWRFGGTLIDDVAEPGQRREAFNILLSMPRGTDPLTVQRAAREFAQIELADHKDVMVLHDHQANPHVHISVRVESKHCKRLNPRKADLHRWRETFAEKLQGHGIEAEATGRRRAGAAETASPCGA